MHAKKIYHALLAAVLALLAFELVTGIVIFFPYKATVPGAYSSTKSIESSGLMGFIQSVHHWGSALLILAGGLAIVFGLVSGGYRVTSKKLWIGGLILVNLFLLLQLTGHLLPWDQHAVRTAVVEAGVGQGTPLVGKEIGNLLRSGPEVGPATLYFWYLAHVAILTLAVAGLGWGLALKLRKLEIGRKTAWACTGGTLLVTVVAAFLVMPKVGPMATSADYGNYTAKPEWYILPMHELLDLVTRINPSIGFVGTLLIPGVAVLLVALAPWIGRGKEGKKAWYGPVLGCILVFGAGVLSIMGIGDMASPAGPNVYAADSQNLPAAKLDPTLIAQGKALFADQRCLGCHSINGKGGNAGPDLSGAATRHPDLQWQIAHLANPKSESPGSTMPPFSGLGQTKLKAIAEYLETLK